MKKEVRLSIYITDEEVIALLKQIQKELSKELCGKKGIPCRLEKGEYVIPFKYLIGIIVKEYVKFKELCEHKGEDADEIAKTLDEIKEELGFGDE